jgi:oxygen-independent coproporphyrinogen III oxidase
MAGIYIHIPFCKQKCTYCDFYKEVSPQLLPDFINSAVKELHLQKDYLKNEPIDTIYFGGGTPSILKSEDFKQIFDAIYSLHSVSADAEITFEANPDDLIPKFFESIKALPFNRISIGIQSFNNDDLKRINRRHTADQAIQAVKTAQQAGFDNLSIDLIYGLPSQTLEQWEKHIEIAFSLNVQHISAYGLTYEEGTALWKQRERGKVSAIDDETMTKMFFHLREKLIENDFKAYEVSNFAKKGFRSRHNTSYWKQEAYLGIGPSAHSYDIESRQWNVSSIKEYTKAINENASFFEREVLSVFDQYNDFVMVRLRTSDGLDLTEVEEKFGSEFKSYCLENIQSFINEKKVDFSNNVLSLTVEGIQISNLILTEIMKV